MKASLALRPLLSLVVLALALSVGEIGFRWMGRTPWQPRPGENNEPTLHAPDARLGWRNKPGRYLVPAYAPGGRETVVTFLDDGRRTTGPVAKTDRVVTLMGCSLTMGWALSDEETMAWKLQRRFPGCLIENRGVAGYGTYQSLLALRDRLARPPLPRLVLYGFIPHHALRNVAAASWLRSLSRSAKRAQAGVPYVTLDKSGAWAGHPPIHFHLWPGADRFALIDALQSDVEERLSRQREADAPLLTLKLAEEMKRLCDAHRIPFAIVILDGSDEERRRYADAFRTAGIAERDCSVPLTPDRLVPGQGHPNGEVNSLWTACVAPLVEGVAEDKRPSIPLAYTSRR